MDFTELYKHSALLSCFSPNSLYLATAVQFRIVIRDSDSLQILHLFTCLDNIHELIFSPDSEYILSRTNNLIQINALNSSWTAKIEEGLAGCSRILYSPDSRHILSFSEFQLRITIWSLISKQPFYIQYPKFSDRGYAFRSDGRYFILADRVDCKDYVSVYDALDWSLIKRWPCDSNDLDNIAWSPDGRFIAVYESCLEYKVYIYYPDGRLVSSYSAYDSGLGIKTVAWTPSSQFLAIGSYDANVRFLNYYTWKPLIEFKHVSQIQDFEIKIYKEMDLRDHKDIAQFTAWDSTAYSSDKIRYQLIKPPLKINPIKLDPEKVNPKLGIGLMKFNCDGSLLATRNDSSPNCLWIWDVVKLKQIALIQQIFPILQVYWNPIVPSDLVYGTGGSHIYTWNISDGCDAIEVPAVSFQIRDFKWNFDGKSLVLMDKDKFTVAFPVDE